MLPQHSNPLLYACYHLFGVGNLKLIVAEQFHQFRPRHLPHVHGNPVKWQAVAGGDKAVEAISGSESGEGGGRVVVGDGGRLNACHTRQQNELRYN